MSDSIIKELIEERKIWLGENKIKDWNSEDTIWVAKRFFTKSCRISTVQVNQIRSVLTNSSEQSAEHLLGAIKKIIGI